MKQISFAIIVAILGAVACSNSRAKDEGQVKTDNVEGNVAIAASNGEAAHMSGEPVQMTKQMFIDEIMDYETNKTEWVYKSDMPGLIDFYADWCRPCKITSPILDELAKEYAGKVKFYKVNVDNERELASVFGVQSIPTFLFMPVEGKPTISSGIAQTPEQTKEMFVKQIEELLLK